MKPRIQPYRAILLGPGVRWRCGGGGVAGFGDSPERAYWDWAGRIREQGVKFKAQEGWDD